jgi:hypothetical protein
MLDPQVIGALACVVFAGWQIGDMLRPALRRIGALPPVAPLPILGGDCDIVPIPPPALQHPAEYYLDGPAGGLPRPRLLLSQDDLRRINL